MKLPWWLHLGRWYWAIRVTLLERKVAKLKREVGEQVRRRDDLKRRLEELD